MIRLIFFVFAVLLAQPVAAQDTIDPDVLAAMPFSDAQGQKVTLQEFRGKLVLLNFWATWCIPCVEEMPDLQELHERYKDKGLAVVSVSQDSRGLPAVREFAARNNLTMPLYLDTKKFEIARVLGIRQMPTTVILDPTGEEIVRVLGYEEWLSDAVINKIEGWLPTKKTR